VAIRDRFRGADDDPLGGCVRYSAVMPNSVLPRRHHVVVETPAKRKVRFVSRERHDPAHARLSTDADRSIVRGAEDGSEMGAFHHVRLAQRWEALVRRFDEFTPAGLETGLIRLD
jgi:hypothetical protein